MAVPSPCISVCQMTTDGRWCEGCQRTLEEIAGWATLSDLDRRRVWKQLPARRAEQDAHTATLFPDDDAPA